jgi:hypothetical protein
VASKVKIPQQTYPALAGPPKPPKAQPSIQSQIFRNNRTAARAFPMSPQKYPKFMNRG